MEDGDNTETKVGTPLLKLNLNESLNESSGLSTTAIEVATVLCCSLQRTAECHKC